MTFYITDPKTGLQVDVDNPEVQQKMYNQMMNKPKETKMLIINQEKLEKITRIINQETDPKATEELIKAEICADWHNEEEHQEWINTASPQEIADWIASFYS